MKCANRTCIPVFRIHTNSEQNGRDISSTGTDRRNTVHHKNAEGYATVRRLPTLLRQWQVEDADDSKRTNLRTKMKMGRGLELQTV
jgi:hypothetical protein